MLRYVDSKQSSKQDSKQPAPFFTIITRCYARPIMLRYAIWSLRQQTCQDYEQIFMVDTEGIGVQKANQACYEYRNEVHGSYIYLYDDDTFFLDQNLLYTLRDLALSNDMPAILLFKNFVGCNVACDPWNENRLGLLSGNAYCLRRDIYQKHIKTYDELPGNAYLNREIDAMKYTLAKLDSVGIAIHRESRGRGETYNGEPVDPKDIVRILEEDERVRRSP